METNDTNIVFMPIFPPTNFSTKRAELSGRDWGSLMFSGPLINLLIERNKNKMFHLLFNIT